jgi:radical SAM protein with 4Fe4S-binding SPASM domain
MEASKYLSPSIPTHIGVRHFGKKLCLINQGRREAWICSGNSMWIWHQIAKGQSVEAIEAKLMAAFSVPLNKVQTDVRRFLDQLWQRELLDFACRKRQPNPTDANTTKSEVAHNKNGQMYTAAYRAGVIFRAWLDLLVPCNLRCRHCYLDFSEKDIVPFKEVCSYLDQLADHGCPEVILTGGEIFLRRDLIDIIAYTETKGFLFDLFTNGILIDAAMADRLRRFNITTVQISLYGTNAKTHEAVTRKTGTFEKSVRGARLLIERGIPVRFAYHIQQDNFDEAFEFPEFAARLGADYEFDSKLVPNRNGSKEPLMYGVTVSQQAQLYRSGLLERKTALVCPAALSKARIAANGDVFPCQLINTATVGNLKRQTLAEIWHSQRRQDLREEILNYKPRRCTSCSHTDDCQPCAAMRGFNEGADHLTKPVSEACLLTAAGLIAQGKTPVKDFRTDDCMAEVLNPEILLSQSPSTLIQISGIHSS